MAVNIEMNLMKDDGTYEVVYPKTVVNNVENAVNKNSPTITRNAQIIWGDAATGADGYIGNIRDSYYQNPIFGIQTTQLNFEVDTWYTQSNAPFGSRGEPKIYINHAFARLIKFYTGTRTGTGITPTDNNPIKINIEDQKVTKITNFVYWLNSYLNYPSYTLNSNDRYLPIGIDDYYSEDVGNNLVLTNYFTNLGTLSPSTDNKFSFKDTSRNSIITVHFYTNLVSGTGYIKEIIIYIEGSSVGSFYNLNNQTYTFYFLGI